MMPSTKLLALALCILGMPAMGQPVTKCASVSGTKKQALIKYVREKYKLPDSVSLALVSDTTVSEACFQKLTFEGKSALKKWELTLFLSPDERYLTSELFDTSVDPAQEEHRKLETLMTGLAENKGASLGPDHAPVTIVEFSDFQCPYCRKFAETLQEVLPSEAAKVRVVFHHMPLSIHPWARAAAEGAACAQLQNSKAFWAIHDQLFLHQSEITPENVRTQLNDLARKAPGQDFTSFESCLDNEMSLGLVIRDINLATSNEITGTPTLFINGHRIQGVKDAAQLRELIAQALNESVAGTE